MKELYKTKVSAVGGRNGTITSEDGVLNLEVRTPKELGGEGGAYTNPEQLFGAGYSACFVAALNLIAGKKKLNIKPKVTATVGLLKAEVGFDLSLQVDAEIEGVDRTVANELLQEAHNICPYSKATKNNIDVKLNLL